MNLKKQKNFEALIERLGKRDDSQWSITRKYLVEQKSLDGKLIDQLHADGKIYANDRCPHPDIVFLHSTQYGKVEGATLYDTRSESVSRRGNKVTAWFTIGDFDHVDTVVALESPIDALSYLSLFPRQHNRFAVVSCGGSTVPSELMVLLQERRQKLVLALNNSAAGNRGAVKAWYAAADMGLLGTEPGYFFMNWVTALCTVGSFDLAGNDALAVANYAETRVSNELMRQIFDRRNKFIVSFNRTPADYRCWLNIASAEAWRDYKSYISPDRPLWRNWSEDLCFLRRHDHFFAGCACQTKQANAGESPLLFQTMGRGP